MPGLLLCFFEENLMNESWTREIKILEKPKPDNLQTSPTNKNMRKASTHNKPRNQASIYKNHCDWGKVLSELTVKMLPQLLVLFQVYFLYNCCYWTDSWEKWKQARRDHCRIELDYISTQHAALRWYSLSQTLVHCLL